MPDLGPQLAYTALPTGIPVISADGQELGEVEHVLGDPDVDIFDGIVFDAFGTHRFVDAPEVAELHERGVVLAIDAAAARRLPEPTDNPGVMEVTADDGRVGPHSDLTRKLRRAWDLVSGKY